MIMMRSQSHLIVINSPHKNENNILTLGSMQLETTSQAQQRMQMVSKEDRSSSASLTRNKQQSSSIILGDETPNARFEKVVTGRRTTVEARNIRNGHMVAEKSMESTLSQSAEIRKTEDRSVEQKVLTDSMEAKSTINQSTLVKLGKNQITDGSASADSSSRTTHSRQVRADQQGTKQVQVTREVTVTKRNGERAMIPDGAAGIATTTTVVSSQARTQDSQESSKRLIEERSEQHTRQNVDTRTGQSISSSTERRLNEDSRSKNRQQQMSSSITDSSQMSQQRYKSESEIRRGMSDSSNRQLIQDSQIGRSQSPAAGMRTTTKTTSSQQYGLQVVGGEQGMDRSQSPAAGMRTSTQTTSSQQYGRTVLESDQNMNRSTSPASGMRTTQTSSQQQYGRNVVGGGSQAMNLQQSSSTHQLSGSSSSQQQNVTSTNIMESSSHMLDSNSGARITGSQSGDASPTKGRNASNISLDGAQVRSADWSIRDEAVVKGNFASTLRSEQASPQQPSSPSRQVHSQSSSSNVMDSRQFFNMAYGFQGDGGSSSCAIHGTRGGTPGGRFEGSTTAQGYGANARGSMTSGGRFESSTTAQGYGATARGGGSRDSATAAHGYGANVRGAGMNSRGTGTMESILSGNRTAFDSQSSSRATYGQFSGTTERAVPIRHTQNSSISLGSYQGVKEQASTTGYRREFVRQTVEPCPASQLESQYKLARQSSSHKFYLPKVND